MNISCRCYVSVETVFGCLNLIRTYKHVWPLLQAPCLISFLLFITRQKAISAMIIPPALAIGAEMQHYGRDRISVRCTRISLIFHSSWNMSKYKCALLECGKKCLSEFQAMNVAGRNGIGGHISHTEQEKLC